MYKKKKKKIHANLFGPNTVRQAQGEPRVFIYTDFVELQSSMLHAKFKDHQTSGFEKEGFQGFNF